MFRPALIMSKLFISKSENLIFIFLANRNKICLKLKQYKTLHNLYDCLDKKISDNSER